MKKDKISITTNKGKSQLGIPFGTNILKNFNPNVRNPTMIQPIKKLKDNNNVRPICAVIVNPKGVIPKRFSYSY